MSFNKGNRKLFKEQNKNRKVFNQNFARDTRKDPTSTTIHAMVVSGELESIFTWIANRLTEFEIRIADTGQFLLGPDENLGILSPEAVSQMLRGDVKHQYPHLTNNVRAELCRQTLKYLISLALRRAKDLPDGYRE